MRWLRRRRPLPQEPAATPDHAVIADIVASLRRRDPHLFGLTRTQIEEIAAALGRVLEARDEVLPLADRIRAEYDLTVSDAGLLIGLIAGKLYPEHVDWVRHH